jgi:hypothetical protein
LHPSIREKLKHYEFVNVNQLLQRAISVESRLKESHDACKSHHQGVPFVDDNSNGPNDDNKELFPTKIKCPVENKMITCPSLKLIHRN